MFQCTQDGYGTRPGCGWLDFLFQSGKCLISIRHLLISIRRSKAQYFNYSIVINAPLQNGGFLILQRWVFNFGTLGFLFVFFIRQSALQPFTRNKKSETISNTHRLTLFLRCCNYKHTSVDLIRLFCAVPATHTPRKRRNGRHVQRAERGKHTVGVCDDGAGCGSPGRA